MVAWCGITNAALALSCIAGLKGASALHSGRVAGSGNMPFSGHGTASCASIWAFPEPKGFRTYRTGRGRSLSSLAPSPGGCPQMFLKRFPWRIHTFQDSGKFASDVEAVFVLWRIPCNSGPQRISSGSGPLLYT